MFFSSPVREHGGGEDDAQENRILYLEQKGLGSQEAWLSFRRKGKLEEGFRSATTFSDLCILSLEATRKCQWF